MKKTMKTVTPPAPATKASAKKTAAPAVKKTVAKRSPTNITAHANIGFGNTLYLRGDGPGLNWDKGVPLDCLSDDKWSLTIEHTTPFSFYFQSAAPTTLFGVPAMIISPRPVRASKSRRIFDR